MSQLSNNFIVTINNPDKTIDEYAEIVKRAGYKYARFQLEKGESGTVHVQGAFGGKRTRLPAVQKLFKCHVEVSKSAIHAWDYCGKTETRIEGPVEFGQPPACPNKKGDKAKRNKMLLQKGAEKAVEDGDIRLLDYAKLKHNIDLYNATTN